MGRVEHISSFGLPSLSDKGAMVLPPVWFTIEAGFSSKLEIVWRNTPPSIN